MLIVSACVLVSLSSDTLVENETVYLLRGLQWLHPHVLAADWAAAYLPGQTPLRLPFDWLSAGLWSVTDYALFVALVGRALTAAAILAASVAVTRALQLPMPAAVVGLGVYLLGDQSFAAGEWLLGGFESKPFAYACLLSALAALLQKRLLLAGLLAGAAVWFHVLVGGWGSLALACAALGFGRSATKASALVAAVPGAAVAGAAVWRSMAWLQSATPLSAAEQAKINQLTVELRNPHHLDPAYFMDTARWVLLPIMVLCTALAIWHTVRLPAQRRVLLLFLAALAALFFSGLVAGVLGLNGWLKFYPFRVPDALLPWLFCVLSASWLYQVVATRQWPRAPGGKSAIAVFVIATLLLLRQTGVAVDQTAEAFGDTLPSWTAQDAESAWAKPWQVWARNALPPDAQLLAHPCDQTTWLAARRATVVNYKQAPVNRALFEWHARMIAANGGKRPSERGVGFCTALDENFPQLDVRQLRQMRSEYGATHYVVGQVRPELSAYLVANIGEAWIYDLRQLPKTP